jgi:hypothetical protein
LTLRDFGEVACSVILPSFAVFCLEVSGSASDVDSSRLGRLLRQIRAHVRDDYALITAESKEALGISTFSSAAYEFEVPTRDCGELTGTSDSPH